MNIIQRVKDILLTPKQTWPVIESESTDITGLYKNYIMILAAIPAVAGFIGMTLIGISVFGVSMRMPFLSGVTQMVVGYALSLAMIYVIALIVDALAPTFGGQKNMLNALKLVAYGGTAGLLGGLFNLIPALAMLGLLASLYSIYLIYVGLPTLMKCPEDKALPYTAVILACGVGAALILGGVSALFAPGPGMRLGASEVAPGLAPPAEITLNTPQGTVTFDTQRMEDWGQRMEAAQKRLEEARKSGDSAAAEQAMREVMATLASNPAQTEAAKP
jgi:hypothetical protein